MSKNHIGETIGVFTIVEQMPYKDTDGHALYKGVCNECGYERIARYYNLKETRECTHIRLDGEVAFCKTNWNNKRIKKIFNARIRSMAWLTSFCDYQIRAINTIGLEMILQHIHLQSGGDILKAQIFQKFIKGNSLTHF